MKNKLHLYLLGTYLATREQQPVKGFTTNKERALLAFLALEGDHPIQREKLANLLWTDTEGFEPRRNLRLALHRLRQALIACDPDWGDIFEKSDSDLVQIKRTSLWTDAGVFDRLLHYVEHTGDCQRGECSQCLPQLEEAVALYRGDFLEGFHIENAEGFAEWARLKRENLHRRALWALYKLAECYRRRGDTPRALAAARRQIELEPWREEAHAQIVGLLARRGEFSAALAQFEKCRRLLANELGIGPSSDLTGLVKRIHTARSNRFKLPEQLTPFVGRTNELSRLTEMMTQPSCRLVTLVGPGGVGKTRLALEAAHQMSAGFLHGTAFISLVDVASPDLFFSALASAMHLFPPAREDLQKLMLSYLREKELLLFLDNFEHLLPLSAYLGQILQAAPDVKILVTSREKLNLHSEWVFEVQGMNYPENGNIENAVEYDAAAFFIQAAERAGHLYISGGDNYMHLARLCQVVEGIPLAIELAAGLTPFLPLEKIISQIEASPDFLQTDKADIPHRHRSMRSLFDGSWRLLKREEKHALAKLSVFRSGFTMPAAEYVSSATSRTISSLVNKSLLRRRSSGRLEFHELLRQFAFEKLQGEPGFEEQARLLHSQYYSRLLSESEPLMKSSGQSRAIETIEADIDNIRAAWSWAIENGQANSLEKAIAPLYLFYHFRGWLKEGEHAFGHLVELSERDPTVCEKVLGMAMARQARFANLLGQLDKAAVLSTRSFEIARSTGDPAEIAFCLALEGSIAYRKSSNYTGAIRLLRQSLELYEQMGDGYWVAQQLDNTGTSYYSMGDYANARIAYQKAADLREQVGDKLGLAPSKNNLGLVFYELGDYQQAAELFEEALEINRQRKNLWGMANGLDNLGSVAFMSGNAREARRCIEEALNLRHEVGQQGGIAFTLVNLATIEEMDGYYEQARLYCLEALHIYHDIQEQWGIIFALETLGHIETALNNYTTARRYFREALQLSKETNLEPHQIDVLTGLGTLFELENQPLQAVELLSLAQANASTRRDTRLRAQKAMARLQNRLSPAALCSAVERGAQLSLITTVEKVLESLAASEEQLASDLG